MLYARRCLPPLCRLRLRLFYGGFSKMRTSRSFPHYHSRPSRDFSFGGKIHGFLSSCDGATAETLRKHCGVPQNKKSLFTAMLSGMVSRGEIEIRKRIVFSSPPRILRRRTDGKRTRLCVFYARFVRRYDTGEYDKLFARTR